MLGLFLNSFFIGCYELRTLSDSFFTLKGKVRHILSKYNQLYLLSTKGFSALPSPSFNDILTRFCAHSMQETM